MTLGWNDTDLEWLDARLHPKNKFGEQSEVATIFANTDGDAVIYAMMLLLLSKLRSKSSGSKQLRLLRVALSNTADRGILRNQLSGMSPKVARTQL